jgi:carbamoyltransferase
MKIIGLNYDMYISSAALLEHGRIIAAAPEERFTRAKRTRAFPANAVRFCLKQAGCGMDDIGAVAVAWNPGVYMQKFNPLFSSQRRFKAEYLYSVPDNVMTLFPEHERQVDHIHQRMVRPGGKSVDVYYVTHHRAHAGNAFLLSPFESAAILTADSQGELESTTLAVGRGNAIEVLEAINHPHSLGAYYATFTEFLGFKPHNDEWKVMALGAYSHWDNAYYRTLREQVVLLEDNGRFRLNLEFFKDFLHELPNLYTPRFVEAFGPPRDPDGPIEDRHCALAAAMQHMAEEVAFHMLRHLHQRTGLDAVCLAGGFFMNSVLNGKILANTPFKRLYVSSCPDDSGNAFGAAAYVNSCILGNTERQALNHNYLGPSYSDTEIAETLAKAGVKAERVADVEATTARLLAEGKLVGWLQGGMEFGQRALGNRSILADPRDASMKDRVNLAVKFREAFRPFAPAVHEEAAEAWFDIEPGTTVPFMEKVYPIRADKRERIQAVVHADGSGRLQTVSSRSNPRFHRLIGEFEKLTGVPIVLNTSFNLNGEPVVCSPTDAIRTFFSCGLDVLVMGNHIVRK